MKEKYILLSDDTCWKISFQNNNQFRMPSVGFKKDGSVICQKLESQV